MRDDLYRHMLRLMETHRTWLEPVRTGLFREIRIPARGADRKILTRAFILESMCTRGAYKRRYHWTITEYELDRGLVRLKRMDPAFRSRLRKGPQWITPQDINSLILVSTHGVLNPRLHDFPVYKQRFRNIG